MKKIWNRNLEISKIATLFLSIITDFLENNLDYLLPKSESVVEKVLSLNFGKNQLSRLIHAVSSHIENYSPSMAPSPATRLLEKHETLANPNE